MYAKEGSPVIGQAQLLEVFGREQDLTRIESALLRKQAHKHQPQTVEQLKSRHVQLFDEISALQQRGIEIPPWLSKRRKKTFSNRHTVQWEVAKLTYRSRTHYQELAEATSYAVGRAVTDLHPDFKGLRVVDHFEVEDEIAKIIQQRGKEQLSLSDKGMTLERRGKPEYAKVADLYAISEGEAKILLIDMGANLQEMKANPFAHAARVQAIRRALTDSVSSPIFREALSIPDVNTITSIETAYFGLNVMGPIGNAVFRSAYDTVYPIGANMQPLITRAVEGLVSRSS